MNGAEGNPVADDECLARYIIRPDHVRKDGTVKPEPFVPFKHTELSVTRHLALSESELWEIGSEVAGQRGTSLVARADVQTMVFVQQKLRAVSAPVEGNPNHANVIDWPPDKQAQKAIALEIALRATVRKYPPVR